MGFPHPPHTFQPSRKTGSPHTGYPYWHERAAFQRSAFGRSTAGNDVVATIFISLFSSFFPVFFPPPRFFFPFFLRRDLFS